MGRWVVLPTLAIAAMGVALALHADNVAGRMLVAVSSTLERQAKRNLGKDVHVLSAQGCAAAFAKRGVRGTFALYDPARNELRVCTPERVATGFLPASTFKIPNALIALEVGSIADATTTIAWDGVERRVNSWNQDHNLATAMRDSAVWFYQTLALRTGAQRMQTWVEKLDYGNRNTGGGLTLFWLTGKLRISALQQIAFLDRFRRGDVPVSTRSQDIVRQIIERERTSEYTLRAKTGWATRPGDDLGWFVGWVEVGEQAQVFALNLDMVDDEDAPLREGLTRQLLAANGVPVRLNPL